MLAVAVLCTGVGAHCVALQHVGALRVTVLVVLAVLVHVSLSAPSSPSASPPDMPSPLAVTPSTTPMAVLTEPVFSLRAKVLALVLAAGLLALVIVLFVRWSHFREQVHLPHRSRIPCPPPLCPFFSHFCVQLRRVRGSRARRCAWAA